MWENWNGWWSYIVEKIEKKKHDKTKSELFV